MKPKGTQETNNYIIKYSGVNSSARTRAGVIIWIHKSSKYTVINYTYWSERMTEVKQNFGRGKVYFWWGDSTPQKKEELEETKTFITNYRKY